MSDDLAQVLVVEDNPDTREALVRRLRMEGYAAAGVHNAAAALEYVENRRPDLMIIDVEMEEVSGLDLLAQLKTSVRGKQIPVLVLTNYEDYERESFEQGADDFLVKGASRDRFFSSVKRLIRQPSTKHCRFDIIFVDGKVSFRADGCVSIPEQRGGGERNPDFNQFNKEMAYLGDDLHTKHKRWLEDFKRDKGGLRSFLSREKRRNWRGRATELGRRLFKEIFDGNPKLREAWGRVQQQTQGGSERLMVRFVGPRESLGLPLELLHEESTPIAARFPMSRQLTDIFPRTRPCWRDFLTGARKNGIYALLVATEDVFVPETMIVSGALRDACANLNIELKMHPSDLSRPLTFEQAESLLKRHLFHIFHYAGHSVFDQKRPELSHLLFWSDHGCREQMRCVHLAELLKVQDVMQFVYLSCCSGAEIEMPNIMTDNRYLGLMDAVVRAGVPAVLGFRWPVVSPRAEVVANSFYRELTRNPLSLEHALWTARKDIFSEEPEGGWDESWFSPILIVQ